MNGKALPPLKLDGVEESLDVGSTAGVGNRGAVTGKKNIFSKQVYKMDVKVEDDARSGVRTRRK